MSEPPIDKRIATPPSPDPSHKILNMMGKIAGFATRFAVCGLSAYFYLRTDLR